MPTGFLLGSLDLRTLATEITSVNGWDTFPGLRAAGTEYVFRHGEDLDGRRFYRARDIDLNIVFMLTDSTGVVTTTPEQHLQANIEALMAALHNSTGSLTLTRTMPNGSTRTAQVRPLEAIPIEDNVGMTRAMVVTLRMGYPFWHGSAGSYTGGSGNVVNNGNAPINDMIVTFTTTGRITTAAGDYIESAAAGLVLNVGTGLVTTGDPADLSTNAPWFIQLEPGTNAITVTGGNKTINFFHAYF